MDRDQALAFLRLKSEKPTEAEIKAAFMREYQAAQQAENSLLQRMVRDARDFLLSQTGSGQDAKQKTESSPRTDQKTDTSSRNDQERQDAHQGSRENKNDTKHAELDAQLQTPKKRGYLRYILIGVAVLMMVGIIDDLFRDDAANEDTVTPPSASQIVFAHWEYWPERHLDGDGNYPDSVQFNYSDEQSITYDWSDVPDTLLADGVVSYQITRWSGASANRHKILTLYGCVSEGEARFSCRWAASWDFFRDGEFSRSNSGIFGSTVQWNEGRAVFEMIENAVECSFQEGDWFHINSRWNLENDDRKLCEEQRPPDAS